MLTLRRILCSGLPLRVLPAAMALTVLAACGQKGDLFLPTDPAAANRVPLHRVLIPGAGGTTPTDPSPPARTLDPATGQGTGTASPVRER